MEQARQTYGYTTGFEQSKVNFFGRRGSTAAAARPSVGQPARQPVEPAGQTDPSAGKPYFPSNGHHRHLNFLGRTSWESRDKLLINRA
ncbi:MAG: hypothetical protein KGY78_11960 [Anaerolineae bacterium]|nr:hypothetical protein [Anaerolineae bacterium]